MSNFPDLNGHSGVLVYDSTLDHLYFGPGGQVIGLQSASQAAE